MMRPRPTLRLSPSTTVPVALLALLPSAAAQEGPTPQLMEPDPVQEMIELFHQVERKLGQIDDHLADAGAGDVVLEEVEDPGLDDLLRWTQSQSRDVEQKIDRILEIAAQMGQGGSGSCSLPRPGGESPLDGSRDKGRQEREKTPEPGETPPPGGEEPESGEEPQDEPGGEKPEDGPNPKDGENAPGDPPDDPNGRPVRPGNEADEWGFLPERLHEVFRNQGRDDLPVQYRTWIDTYYTRLNRADR